MNAPPSATEQRRRTDRRRGGDRRRGASADRRRPDPEPQSWFGALDLDDLSVAEAQTEPPRVRDSDVWAQAEVDSRDSRFLSREARRIAAVGVNAYARLYGTFLAARAAIGLLLLAVQAVAAFVGPRAHTSTMLLCIAYAAQTLALWLLPQLSTRDDRPTAARLTRRQWVSTVGFDIALFASLHVLERSGTLNYDALMLMPVLMAGVLATRRQAVATAAGVALFLLGAALWMVALGGQPTNLLTQAGVTGAGLFVASLLAGELAGRLAREEMAARGSLELARQQAQLNRLVLEQLTDGVLVIDRRGRVRSANPAARLLIVAEGMGRPAPFALRGVPAWEPLVQAVERAFADGQWPEAGRDVTLPFSAQFQRTLRVRVRFTRRSDAQASEELCVIFVEDVLRMQARLRQEKLAAMGRVSAGIAHEIRNPLAAIAQANALIGEDASDPAQARLSKIVADNVERLKRIVDDVLDVAPGGPLEPTVIDGTAMVGTLTSEWAATAGLRLGDQCPLHVELPHEPLGVHFDAEHLRRVLVNLLDNGKRHASGAAGSVRLTLTAADEREATLVVASDGPPIGPEVERYLFEPFFSTRSRGTGLGLYICRELCERSGARIDYRQRPADAAHRNEFIVTMRRAALTASESRLQLVP